MQLRAREQNAIQPCVKNPSQWPSLARSESPSQEESARVQVASSAYKLPNGPTGHGICDLSVLFPSSLHDTTGLKECVLQMATAEN